MTAIGKRAVVIGAGMGGLAAAGALVGHFDDVVVLERDSLPDRPDHRAGAPQGRHVHALLTAGQQALERLLPGFTDGIVAAGAVKVRANSDVRVEMPRYDPYPQRDLGWLTYAASRPLLEFVTRQLAEAAGVRFEARCRVRALETSADGARITAVRFERDGGESDVLECDLVVDASGRAAPTLPIEQIHSPPSSGASRPPRGTPPGAGMVMTIFQSAGGSAGGSNTWVM